MIRPVITDPVLVERLARLPPDGITLFTLEGDSVRGAVVSATAMVALMRESHGLGLLETLVLGKAYVAAALLSATIKGEDRLSLRVDGDGPARGWSVECTTRGEVRGRLFAAPFPVDVATAGLDTAPLVGAGTLSMTRFMEGRTDPVTGTAALRTGRLAEDLAWYFHVSEQLRTSFTLGVHFDAEGRVAGAGGLYLQALPFASDEILDRVERLVLGLPSLGETFATGASRSDLCLRSFPFFDYNMLDDRRVEFICPCTRERLGSFIASLPPDELADLAANGPFPVSVTCHNCGSVYEYGKDEVEAMKGGKAT